MKAVDLVVACAGVAPENGDPSNPKVLWELSSQDFDDTIDVNVKGVANMARHFVPFMIQNEDGGNGAFVAFSSGLGRSAHPSASAYCASKWAVEGMMKSLAISLPKSLAAVPLAPGIVKSGISPCGVDVERWVEVAGPAILAFGPEENGKSVSLDEFYTAEYMESWVIKDGAKNHQKMAFPGGI